MRWSAKPVIATSLRDVEAIRGFESRSLRQAFERSLLPRFELVFARLIPVRRLAGRANPRFADCTFSRHPLVGATITFIPLLLERDHAHVINAIPDNNILSRSILCLTNIYLSSNIFLR
jgi:hypothetical protein